MISWFLLSVALAQEPAPPEPAEPAVAEAPPCPEVGRWVSIARNDALSFFLVDARNDLLKAVDGFACSAPASAEAVASFYSVQGLLWWYEDRPEKARRALAAAKALGADFDPELGDELVPEWESASLPEGDAVPLTLDGRGEAEWLAVDGTRTEATTLRPGLHLLQVGLGEEARFARVVDVEGGSPMVVALPPPVAGAEVPVAPAEPDPEPAPEPEATPLVAGATLVPITRRTFRAPDGSELRWRPDVRTLAKADADGRIARRRLAGNGRTQGVAIALTTGMAYGSYLMLWDATQGRNLPAGQSTGGAMTFAVGAVAAGLWEARLRRRRAMWRDEVIAGAGRSWSPDEAAEASLEDR